MSDESPNQDSLRGRDLIGLGGLLVAAVVGGLVIGLLVDAAGHRAAFALVGISIGITSAASASGSVSDPHSGTEVLR